MSLLKRSRKNKQSGFTLIELMIGVVILAAVLQMVGSWVKEYIHNNNIEQAAKDVALVPIAVQRRNGNDGFLFSFWDTNGSNTATNATITWEQNDFSDLLDNYLVGRRNTACGSMTDGWNPVNTGGDVDTGDETSMETAALVPCSKLRRRLPFDVEMSAALSQDITGAVDTFALYLDTSNADFDVKDYTDNNFINFKKWQSALKRSLDDSTNGLPNVVFGSSGSLDDISDDVIYTDTECEDELIAGNTCEIIVYLEFAGLTNGRFKRTDNQDYFMDDVTFGESIAAGRQQCAYYEEDLATGTWTSSIVDCAIRAGAGDTDVTLIVDRAQTSELLITSETATATHMCNLFEEDGSMLEEKSGSDGTSPCGFTTDGDIVQLVAKEAHVGTVYSEDIIASEILSASVELYSDVSGQVMIRLYDSSHSTTVFSVDNAGNTSLSGTLSVGSLATFSDQVFMEKGLSVQDGAAFNMQNASTVAFGDSTDSSLTFSRDGLGTFTIETDGVGFEILGNSDGEGIKMENLAGDLTINLDAKNGVIAENGTTIHSSKSTLLAADFSASGIVGDDLKNLSEVVTADMAKYLDDTSSPVQLIGTDRVEGTFMQMTKPDCLAFMDDSNFTSSSANPYRQLIDSGTLSDGEDYARLILIPTYMKTYNSAFGDNQIYAQHAAHSSPTTWDIYLYLSGEGAFNTGAREDAAGGAIAMTLCDYSSINFSNLQF